MISSANSSRSACSLRADSTSPPRQRGAPSSSGGSACSRDSSRCRSPSWQCTGGSSSCRHCGTGAPACADRCSAARNTRPERRSRSSGRGASDGRPARTMPAHTASADIDVTAVGRAAPVQMRMIAGRGPGLRAWKGAGEQQGGSEENERSHLLAPWLRDPPVSHTPGLRPSRAGSCLPPADPMRVSDIFAYNNIAPRQSGAHSP